MYAIKNTKKRVGKENWKSNWKKWWWLLIIKVYGNKE
jgi:hypothetical protein